MIKKWLLLFLLFLPQLAIAQQNLPPTMQWRGQSLKLSYQEKNDKTWLAEYIAPTEKLEAWSQLFGTWFYPTSLNAKDILQQKANFVKLKKQGGDIAANYNVFMRKDPKSGEMIYVIDFLLSKNPIYEHSVYFFSEAPGGVRAYQYSRRYDPKLSGSGAMASPEALIRSILQEREAIFKEMAREDLPQWPKVEVKN